MFSGILDPDDYNVKLIKHIIMKKYYFAFLCALMAATCALAAQQSGDRVVAAQALTVEWNDVAFRPTMDGTSFDLGWNAQLTPSEDENVLVLSGLCDMFDIPVHVDHSTGKAWIETGTPLDAYTDGDVVRTIYALPEQWLVDAEADMNTNLYGTILEDGSIAFDGGVVFLVSESMAGQDLAVAGDANETVWMSSPLFRNMRLLVPNAVHQFTLVNDPVNFEAVATTESTSSSDQGNLTLVNVSDLCKIDRTKYVIQGGKRPPRNDPGGATTCGVVGDLVVVSQSAPSGGGVIMLHPSALFEDVLSGKKIIVYNPDKPRGGVGGSEVAFVRPTSDDDVITRPNLDRYPNGLQPCGSGKRPPRNDPGGATTCGVVGDLVVVSQSAPSGGGGVVAASSVIPFNPGDMPHPFEIIDSAGRKPVKPREVRPCGGGGGLNDYEVATRRPTGGGDVRAAANDSDNPNDAIDLTKGKKFDPKNPNNPTPCSDPWIWVVSLDRFGSQLPTRFNNNTPSVASSKPESEEFSVPVYVFQNPDDNTITVYNLYGSGYVMTCMIVPEERKMSIADVTDLIDHLLSNANQVIDDVNQDGKVNIDDVTTMIDTLLNAAN